MKRLMHKITIALIAVMIPIAFMTGFGVGAMEEPQKPDEVYTVEMWDDGTVKIITGQEYINQLSEHTVIVTDKTLDEVTHEIRIAEDLP